MGINYYATFSREIACEICDNRIQLPEYLHIGKSSVGWCFSLHVNPQKGINNLEDWERIFSLPKVKITEWDYEGESITAAAMRAVIVQRRCPVPRILPDLYVSWQDFHNINRSLDGPNGLFRHRVDGHHCVGHGEGTWDYIACEFC